MTEPGMDPERTSLLVTRLFADIVPGDLTVARLISVEDILKNADGKLVLSGMTSGPECPPPCNNYEWQGTGAREYVEAMRAYSGDDREAYGLLDRSGSSSIASFTQGLDSHLRPESTNSQFTYPFVAASSWLRDRREVDDRNQLIVWLSDGQPDDPGTVGGEIGLLKSESVDIAAVVFGAGQTHTVASAGLTPVQVQNPKDIMEAFTQAFRLAMGAPYGHFNRIAAKSTFKIQPYVDEAWVVVYGDHSLSSASLDGPGGVVSIDGPHDSYGSAGAYRTVYMERPERGEWQIQASGGGADVAFAVIQRLDLVPELIEPETVMATVPTPIVVGLFSEGGLISDPEVLTDLEIELEFDGGTALLNDLGKDGDETAGDGRFTGTVSFPMPGEIEVELEARSPLLVRSNTETNEVIANFEYTGGPIHIDLGQLTEDDSACKPLDFSDDAEHDGPVPFSLDLLDELPDDHFLEIRIDGEVLKPGLESRLVSPGAEWEVCLVTGERAPITESEQEDWLRLHVSGSTLDRHAVPIQLSWEVDGLSWWELWRHIILAILALLLLLIIIYGYIHPSRFPRGLAIILSTEEDMDEGSRYPVSQHKGTGVGCYRDARVCIASDYRIIGDSRLSKATGAVVRLRAHKRLVKMRPVGGYTIEHLNADDDWEAIPQDRETTLRFGNVYRLGGQAELYFEVRRG